MKSSQNRSVDPPKLKLGLVGVVILLIAAVSLFSGGPPSRGLTIIPSPGLEAATATIAPLPAPTVSQGNSAWFPPRSDLGGGLGQDLGGAAMPVPAYSMLDIPLSATHMPGELLPIPGNGTLSIPPSGAQLWGEPPSSTGTFLDQARNTAKALGASVEGQMRREPPSSKGNIGGESPSPVELLESPVDEQMRGEPPSVSGKMSIQLPGNVATLGTAISLGMSGPKAP